VHPSDHSEPLALRRFSSVSSPANKKPLKGIFAPNNNFRLLLSLARREVLKKVENDNKENIFLNHNNNDLSL
jgi:hypothetical protein